jgi:predicted transposase YbfD/YdcC
MMEIFETLEDNRDARGRRHELINVIIMSIYAILSGNVDCENMADWLELRKDYFTCLLHLENGTPSANTLLRVFRGLEPTQFMDLFSKWIKSMVSLKGGHIAIDGKAIKSATDKINDGNIPYVVSAFLTEVGISVGQVKTDDKSNEITAIPDLLDLLDLEGVTITIDAIGTQKEIVNKIVSKKGHYCLNVKNNQKSLFWDIDEYFKFALEHEKEVLKLKYYETKTYDHGRIETREYYIVDDLYFLTTKSDWKNISSVGLVINTREINGEIRVQWKYYILDSAIEPENLASLTRNHWQIENNLHWVLDVHFKEDLSRSRKDESLINLSLIRKICFNLVKLDDSFGNISIKKKLNSYAFNLEYIQRLLFRQLPQLL